MNEHALVWYPKLGYGHHTAPPMDYDEAYFDNYVNLDETEMGKKLTNARSEFVSKYFSGEIVDIGVGAGRFCFKHGAKGYDVNKKAVEMLKGRKIYLDPYEQAVDAITCWDSLEHIPDPDKLINQVNQWVFVSMPIYESEQDVLSSKHYKPGEHLWYWTHEGLLKWFMRLGFGYVTHNEQETKLGREGIKTYAFKRICIIDN